MLWEGGTTMTEHNLFSTPYASFTNEQLPLLKVAALYFDKRLLGHRRRRPGRPRRRETAQRRWGSGDRDADHGAGEVRNADRRSHPPRIGDREFLDLCDAQSWASGKQCWTLSLAKMPQDVQTDQTR